MKIGIIGAGLSGLSCAYRLEQQGFRGTIEIFEKKPEVGAANIFLEFVSELFHRPIGDLFSYLAEKYQLSLKPQHSIHQTQTIGPTQSCTYHGYMGYVVVRGNHPHSLEKQLARQIQSPIFCNQEVDSQRIARDYDRVVIATGRLQDVPVQVGVRMDRYVHFYHGLMKGAFDVNLSKMWLNDEYALKGNAFQLTLDEHTSMVAVATPVPEFDLKAGWSRFIKNEMGKGVVLDVIHEVENFAIGQPKQYTFQNQIFVGNVGGGVQPALGFGLHTAILSGIYAADSIIHNIKYENLMAQHTKEYMWSLALRNALEKLGNKEYDLLVSGLNTKVGHAILRKGGFNINRVLGKWLTLVTNETKKSFETTTFYPYKGREIHSREGRFIE